MKILLYNIGYGTGLNGTVLQYAIKFWRYLLAPKSVINKIGDYIKNSGADVNLILEADNGSPRSHFISQVQKLSKTLHTTFNYSECKYGVKSVWRRLPYYNNCHNGILSHIDGKIQSHYLNRGLKRLVLEFKVSGISIFLVHLARIGKKMRKKQMDDLTKILKNCDRPYLVCGDFNAFAGVGELKDFIEANNLIVTESAFTFPANNPKKKLDFILATKDLNVEQLNLVSTENSDHLPIMVEVFYTPL